MEHHPEIWVYAEASEGRVARVSFELLGKATEIGCQMGATVAAILIGSDVEGVVSELAAHGAGKVYLVEDPRLVWYQSLAYVKAFCDLITSFRPDIVLVGATHIGQDLASRVAGGYAQGSPPRSLTARGPRVRLAQPARNT